MMSDTSLKEDLIHMYNLQLGRGICFLLCVPSATARQAGTDSNGVQINTLLTTILFIWDLRHCMVRYHYIFGMQ